MTTSTDPQSLIAKARKVCEAATPGPWTVDVITGDIEPYGDEFQVISRDIDGPNGVGLNTGEEYQMYSVPDAEFIATARTLVPALSEALEEMTREWERTGQSATSCRQSLKNCRHELATLKDNMPGFVADAYAKGRAFNEDVDDRTSEDE